MKHLIRAATLLKHATIMFFWAALFMSFVAYNVVIAGAVVYVVMVVDAMESRQVIENANTRTELQRFTHYLQDVRKEFNAKNKLIQKGQ
jgi:uncharacterized protein YpmS